MSKSDKLQGNVVEESSKNTNDEEPLLSMFSKATNPKATKIRIKKSKMTAVEEDNQEQATSASKTVDIDETIQGQKNPGRKLKIILKKTNVNAERETNKREFSKAIVPSNEEDDVDFEPIQKKPKKHAKKVQQKRTYPVIKVRTSPKTLCEAIQGLKPNQKECVKNMGFGDLLEMKIDGIPSKLGYYVVENMNTEEMELVMGEKIVKITEESIHEILGFPLGETTVYNHEYIADNHPDILTWRGQFEKKEARPTDVKQKIIDSDEADFIFKMNFLILLYNTMIDTNKSGTCCLTLLNYIDPDTDITRINWCECLFSRLKFSKSTWAKDAEKSYYVGPITYLILLYVDRVECEAVKVRNQRPLIAAWTAERLRRRESEEIESGGFGMGNLVGGCSIHLLQNDDAESETVSQYLNV